MELILLIVNLLLLLTLVLLFVFKKPSTSDGAQLDLKHNELKGLIDVLQRNLQRLEVVTSTEIARNREELNQALKDNRQEVGSAFNNLGTSTNKTLTDIASIQKSQLESFALQLQHFAKTNELKMTQLQEQEINSALANRTELAESLKRFQEVFAANVQQFNDLQKQKFEGLQMRQNELNATTEARLNSVREVVEQGLQNMQAQNAKKLDEMRATVDEKLQATVEKRFNESFKIISDRLEQVHKGLGEMQTLASGVGDLKKVLTNVKTRGTLGEIQLGTILEQFLSPEQYERNAMVKHNSNERVEFAIKLPGRDSNDKPILLPIDSKFSIEDYQRLLEAYENAGNYSAAEIEVIARQFESAVKKNAKDIREKYINPPTTSDFAIMFVPIEGLYAEILRRTALFETLQREYKITVVGPSNLVAFLSSLQMGFRTLAIEKRSSEVWEILGAIKTEFGKFGVILDKTRKKLLEATKVIDDANVRTRAIERKLRDVQELPSGEASKLLGDAIDFDLDDLTDEEE